ncbi:MAG: hypothetical protein Q8O55_12110 [Dehalococcoidales bacterium]|nr:hypothetical protein [Dehalococcoidales bacterium]
MKIRSAPNFSKLKKHLTGLAAVDLMRLSPEYVYEFIEAGSRGELPSVLLPTVVSMNPQFQKWRSICTDLMDVEYHKHRLTVCLSLMNLKNPSSVSEGEWLDYQFSYWAVLTQGLISKFEKLSKSIYRKFPTPDSSETSLKGTLQNLHEYHTRLKKVRDPVAHPGGPVRIVGQDEHLGPYIVFRGEFQMSTLMDSLTGFYSSWTTRAFRFSNMVLEEIDHISKSLVVRLPKIIG